MKIFLATITLCFLCNILFCQNVTLFVKDNKKTENRYYLTTELLNDTIIFFQLNTEPNCTTTSIFGIAKRGAANIFVSTNLYYNLIQSFANIDSNLFDSPSNSKIFLDFTAKNTCNISGVNTGLFFGHSTKLSGKYSVIEKKKNHLFNCRIEDAIGSYQYEKFDTIVVQTFEAPHPLFKAKNITVRKGINFYYFPFYVNGYVPFFVLNKGIFWMKDSDIAKYSFILKL